MNGILMKCIRGVFATTILLAASASSHADQTDPRLDGLFEKLRISEVFSIAHATEQQIWIIWHQPPEIPEVAEIMEDGLQAMRESRADSDHSGS